MVGGFKVLVDQPAQFLRDGAVLGFGAVLERVVDVGGEPHGCDAVRAGMRLTCH